MTDPERHSPVFDPVARQGDTDARLVAALERLSRVFRLLLREAARTRGLSPVQVRILVHLAHHGPGLRRVGRLAEEFDLTPATVSDAVSTLERKGLVRKTPSERDGRVVVLALTAEGETAAGELSGWADVVRERVASLPADDRGATLEVLLELISSLQEAGVIRVGRMCVTCRFFGEGEGPDAGAPHYCHLLDRPLPVAKLRLDCPEHRERESAPG